MICAKCFKKIPPGEEVQRGSSITWRAGSWGGGYGSEVICKSCAKKQRRWEKKLFLILIIFCGLTLILAIVIPIITLILKNN